jgi:hypothetical protein
LTLQNGNLQGTISKITRMDILSDFIWIAISNPDVCDTVLFFFFFLLSATATEPFFPHDFTSQKCSNEDRIGLIFWNCVYHQTLGHVDVTVYTLYPSIQISMGSRITNDIY